MYGKGVRKRKHSKEFKIEIVEKNLNDGISVRDLAKEHSLYRCLVEQWRRIYLEKGPDGFNTKPKGRPKGTTGIGRPRKNFDSEVERLRYEIAQLKLENLRLKKLHAYLRGDV